MTLVVLAFGTGWGVTQANDRDELYLAAGACIVSLGLLALITPGALATYGIGRHPGPRATAVALLVMAVGFFLVFFGRDAIDTARSSRAFAAPWVCLGGSILMVVVAAVMIVNRPETPFEREEREAAYARRRAAELADREKGDG
ncbi:hypothetical protein KC207_07445 [Phycicoccus sp. BSK3Z-2]|uniref:Uncharacterized protein n=1 Tax=Phycicoccus avicenniae TaxID=2828860 RepID=A0A941HZM2_9MICO|nr:hypothetical protein [Phycicoccus avicenniae]MBR7743122.1 hypothetical protein [Phycicoccus avicenniae]